MCRRGRRCRSPTSARARTAFRPSQTRCRTWRTGSARVEGGFPFVAVPLLPLPAQLGDGDRAAEQGGARGLAARPPPGRGARCPRNVDARRRRARPGRGSRRAGPRRGTRRRRPRPAPARARARAQRPSAAERAGASREKPHGSVSAESRTRAGATSSTAGASRARGRVEPRAARPRTPHVRRSRPASAAIASSCAAEVRLQVVRAEHHDDEVERLERRERDRERARPFTPWPHGTRRVVDRGRARVQARLRDLPRPARARAQRREALGRAPSRRRPTRSSKGRKPHVFESPKQSTRRGSPSSFRRARLEREAVRRRDDASRERAQRGGAGARARIAAASTPSAEKATSAARSIAHGSARVVSFSRALRTKRVYICKDSRRVIFLDSALACNSVAECSLCMRKRLGFEPQLVHPRVHAILSHAYSFFAFASSGRPKQPCRRALGVVVEAVAPRAPRATRRLGCRLAAVRRSAGARRRRSARTRAEASRRPRSAEYRRRSSSNVAARPRTPSSRSARNRRVVGRRRPRRRGREDCARGTHSGSTAGARPAWRMPRAEVVRRQRERFENLQIQLKTDASDPPSVCGGAPDPTISSTTSTPMAAFDAVVLQPELRTCTRPGPVRDVAMATRRIGDDAHGDCPTEAGSPARRGAGSSAWGTPWQAERHDGILDVDHGALRGRRHEDQLLRRPRAHIALLADRLAAEPRGEEQLAARRARGAQPRRRFGSRSTNVARSGVGGSAPSVGCENADADAAGRAAAARHASKKASAAARREPCAFALDGARLSTRDHRGAARRDAQLAPISDRRARTALALPVGSRAARGYGLLPQVRERLKCSAARCTSARWRAAAGLEGPATSTACARPGASASANARRRRRAGGGRRPPLTPAQAALTTYLTTRRRLVAARVARGDGRRACSVASVECRFGACLPRATKPPTSRASSAYGHLQYGAFDVAAAKAFGPARGCTCRDRRRDAMEAPKAGQNAASTAVDACARITSGDARHATARGRASSRCGRGPNPRLARR